MVKEYILKINWDREIDAEILQNNLEEIKDFIKNNCYCTGVSIKENTLENRGEDMKREIKDIIRMIFHTLGIIFGVVINHIPIMILFVMLDIEFIIELAKREIIEEIRYSRN